MQPERQKPERLTPAEVLERILQILSQQETNKFCPKCQRYVLAVRPGTSRRRQLFLSIVTLGLWMFVWIVDSVRRPGWRCTACDDRVG